MDGEAGARARRDDGRPGGRLTQVEAEPTADSRWGTNSYLVEDLDSHDAVVIDANFEPEAVIAVARRRAARVRAILLTHTDADHIAGLPALLEAFGPLPVAVHPAERETITEGTPLRSNLPFPSPIAPEVVDLVEATPFRAGSLTFSVLHTPGHSPGGVSLAIANLLFTGDALFAGSIGRSDFPNSDGEALLEAIHSKLLTRPEDSVVLAGHGPASTIGREKQYNPFL